MSAHVSSYTKSKVFWNLPTESCTNKDGTPMIELDNYGIRHNEMQKFFGEEIVIFYEDKIAPLPYINLHNTSDVRNGGLPQMVNRTEYLKFVKQMIVKAIPNETFSGLAIIDIEMWRPDYDLNWTKLLIYRNLSMERVRSRDISAGLNKTEIERIAREEFNEAARWIFTETIRLGRKLRPSGRWGYYFYPFVQLDKTTHEATDNFLMLNDRLDWLWSEVNAIFPSFYFEDQIKLKEDYFNTVKVMMDEANRIADRYDLPVYAYTKFEFDAYVEAKMFDYYDKADICKSVKTLADMGAEGIIIWGTKNRMDERCSNISAYVNNVLGPTVKYILDKHQKCREKRCNNHGSCVLIDRHEETICTYDDRNREKFRCVCDPDYTGRFCINPRSSINSRLPTVTVNEPTTTELMMFDYSPNVESRHKDLKPIRTQSCSYFVFCNCFVVFIWSFYF